MKAFENSLPTKGMFIFLKYNTIPREEDILLSETDEILYEEFTSKLKKLEEQLQTEENGAKATLSALFSMFGFNRHYCSMTGQPIIGKYYKIGGKIVSKEAYEAHKIIQEIDRKQELIARATARAEAEQNLNEGYKNQ